jgi:hypothetical protein
MKREGNSSEGSCAAASNQVQPPRLGQRRIRALRLVRLLPGAARARRCQRPQPGLEDRLQCGTLLSVPGVMLGRRCQVCTFQSLKLPSLSAVRFSSVGIVLRGTPWSTHWGGSLPTGAVQLPLLPTKARPPKVEERRRPGAGIQIQMGDWARIKMVLPRKRRRGDA